ncbi:MAG: ankyrin repeat domain-containing protein [Lentisphaeria bacterium]|nr:ankyrin repeat domain-containing protein [Lentisphaerota bacterium]MBR2625866.1 ankyrin repeat domain-containing protein [Lentisphaeria bacterium]
METAFRNLKRLPFSTILAAYKYGLNNISVPESAKLGAKLCMAILRGDNLEMKNLLTLGAPLNHQDDPDGWTPLFYSIYYNNPHAKEIILALGADIHQTDYSKRTSLMIAAIRDDSDLLLQLIRKGIDVTARDHKGKSALDFAAEYNSHKCIRILAEYVQ